MCGKYGVGFSTRIINVCGILANIINTGLKIVIFLLKKYRFGC